MIYVLLDVNLQICDKSFNKTPQGYLQVQGIISRSGKQDYFAGELGLNDRMPHERISLERPIAEVTDSISVASFLNMPITDEHPEGGKVGPENFSKFSKGTVTDAEPTDSGHVKCSMIIYDASLIRKIEGGKTELSAGYTAELEFSDDGKTAIQRKIRGNHVAFVDAARCGKECSIFDNKPMEETNMAKLNIDGVEYEVSDSVAPIINKTVKKLEKVEKSLIDSQAEVSKQKALADAAEEKAKAAEKKLEDEEEDDEEKKMENEKKIQDAVNARLGTLISASKFLKDYDPTGKSLLEIKTDVLNDAMPELDLTDKDEMYVNTRFDILVEDQDLKGSSKLEKGLMDHMNTDINDGESGDMVAKARAAKIARNNGGDK